MSGKLLLVGCGKMGSALLGGYLKNGRSKDSIVIIEPFAEMAQTLRDTYGVEVVSSLDEIAEDVKIDIIQLSVKPQMMADVLPAYKERFGNAPLFVSIAAGKGLSFFEKHLAKDSAIIRVMPNLPALVGKGASAMIANAQVSDAQKREVEALFASVGQALWLENESQMDAVTAISGSGPAYVFHFIEALHAAALKLGLPEEMAKAFAYSTIGGSAEMAMQSEYSAAELRVQVTSPKGTTEAGLNVLMQELPSLIERTARAASDRSKELAN